MPAVIEIDKYNLLYGKVLSVMKDVNRAKALTIVLYNIISELNISPTYAMKYVTESGLRFNDEIYAQMNKSRTNSSQIGFIDSNAINRGVYAQINLVQPVTTNKYVDGDYANNIYVE